MAVLRPFGFVLLVLLLEGSTSYLFQTRSFNRLSKDIEDIVESALSEGANTENEGYFEGDIQLNAEQKLALELYDDVNVRFARGIMKDPTKLWINGKVPYVIMPELASEPAAMAAITSAISEWETLSCIHFVPRTTEADYIEIFAGSGCWSYVGRQGGMQQLSLKDGCWQTGTVVHEFGHALGFWHEQSRPDRDQFVEIVWDNIPEEKKHNFNKYSHDQIDSLGVPYDYYSVMHYSATAFGNGNITIRSLDSSVVQLGQRFGLTPSDITQADLLYSCNGQTTKPNSHTPPTPIPQDADSCDFENGVCGFQNVAGDDFDWTYRLANTPSKGTGPDGDRTTGRIGFFMYIEASYPRVENDTARLVSKQYQNTKSCLNFYYHMQGSDIGTLKVYLSSVESGATVEQQILSKSGAQGSGWQLASVALPSHSSPYQIIFEAERAGSYSGDIAVDDIYFSDTGC